MHISLNYFVLRIRFKYDQLERQNINENEDV